MLGGICLRFRCKNYEVLSVTKMVAMHDFNINSPIYGGQWETVTIPCPWGVVYFDRLIKLMAIELSKFIPVSEITAQQRLAGPVYLLPYDIGYPPWQRGCEPEMPYNFVLVHKFSGYQCINRKN